MSNHTNAISCPSCGCMGDREGSDFIIFIGDGEYECSECSAVLIYDSEDNLVLAPSVEGDDLYDRSEYLDAYYDDWACQWNDDPSPYDGTYSEM